MAENKECDLSASKQQSDSLPGTETVEDGHYVPHEA